MVIDLRDGGRMPRVRLDHLSYAAGPDGLANAVQRLGSTLGAGFDDGGLHPGFGTRNFILPLAGNIYLEAVGALDHPAVDKAAFGRAVRQRCEAGGGWLAWVIAVDDIAPFEQRLGRQAIEGQRRRPDGTVVRWKQIGVQDLLDDPTLPFFVEWQCEPEEHPAANGRPLPRMEKLEICGNPDTVAVWLGTPLEIHVPVEWVDGDRPGVVAVHFTTAHGTVRID